MQLPTYLNDYVQTIILILFFKKIMQNIQNNTVKITHFTLKE